ncbi:unnamed protein product, partial [Effrenium voratum]
TPCRISAAPTPQRANRTPPSASQEDLPPEVYALSWPSSFLDAPRGERLELSENGAVATRSSGINKGIALLGPLSLERGMAYFEVEVQDMAKCSQSMAIGLTSQRPGGGRPLLRLDCAREDAHAVLLGYDLPKIFADGKEVGKINAKHWRPLKDLTVGTRVGLLMDRNAMELAVYVNGMRKVTAALPGTSQRWAECWGMVDVHGNVRALRLRPGKRSVASPVRQVPPPPKWAQAPMTPVRLASTQEMNTPNLEGAAKDQELPKKFSVLEAGRPPFSLEPHQPQKPPKSAESCRDLEVTASAKKRLKLSAHACGCRGATGSALTRFN